MSAENSAAGSDIQGLMPLINGIGQAYDSGLYSDITIQCGSRQWKVHRIIIYSASRFFLKTGEGAFKEGRNKFIDLPEMDPNILDKALCYIYKRDYSVDPVSALTVHPEVYRLADYLDMPELKRIVIKKFKEAVLKHWDTVAFTQALRTIYTSTVAEDRGLRDAAKWGLKRHKKALRQHQGFTELVEGSFADGRFMMDVLDAWTAYEDEEPHVPEGPVAKRPRKTKPKAQE